MSSNYPLYNKELSWLSFNYRVLLEAKDPTVPLYERIRFLAIYSSNLDEFFRVKVASLQNLLRLRQNTLREVLDFNPADVLRQIHNTVHTQQEEFGKIYKQEIIPALAAQQIILYQGGPLAPAHEAEVQHYFNTTVMAYLQPVFLRTETNGHHFLQNRALYFAVQLVDRENGAIRYAYINIPSDQLPRYMQLSKNGDQHHIIPLDEIIRLNLPVVFRGYAILGCYAIKLNRDEDMMIDDEHAGDLVKKIKEQLEKRKTGAATRFLYDAAMNEDCLNAITAAFALRLEELVPGGRYHNMFDLFKLPNPLKPNLEFEPQRPLYKEELELAPSLIDAVAEKDYLLHFPYHSYDYVLRFFNEAAIDPLVTDIKVALYRVAGNSLVANALISAARNGKKVTVFVEVKARFDEANNLRWAAEMEKAGVNIIYSIPGLKVHAKIALIKRYEKDGTVKNYGYLATGNFNENTAGIYADHGLFTAHPGITGELDELFKFLKTKTEPKKFKHLLVAQFNMKKALLKKIDREIKAAKKGIPAHLLIKLNGLEESDMIAKLYEASQAGVQTDMIVRGICTLVPGLPAYSAHITVRRLVDRYLEHARVFIFQNNGEEEVYLSSADWMNRNLNRRIEVGFPLYDEALKAELKQLVALQMKDNTKMRLLNETQEHLPVPALNGEQVRAQYAAYEWLKQKETLVSIHIQNMATLSS
jgi:polyphosphate kinase